MTDGERNAPRAAHWPAALRRLRVSLRPEQACDEAFVRHLYHASRSDEVAAAGWPEAMALRFLDAQFRLQRTHFATCHPGADFLILLAAAARGQPAAPAGRLYLDRTGSTWRLLEIGLLRAWQGRGIGAALIGWLQKDAVAAGADAIALQVLHTNPRAVALYRRLGFADAASLVTTHHGMIWHPAQARAS